MDSLLCDEKWVSTPVICSDREDSLGHASESLRRSSGPNPHHLTKQDREAALRVWLNKETDSMPAPGFVGSVESNGLAIPRFRLIQWLIKSTRRLKLSYGTLFLASNYFDRFVSLCECQEWKDWMVELLSVACLSVAAKFSETYHSSPSLHEIQVEDLEHSFHPITIQRMELMLLKILGWRLSAVTPYSYMELLIQDIDFLQYDLHEQLTTQITDLLLLAVSDIKLMEFRPSVVAASAVRRGLELFTSLSDAHLTVDDVTKFIHQDQRENLIKCHKLMEERLANPFFNSNSVVSSPCGGQFNYYPSSPVTVLPTDRIGTYERHVDLSLFEMQGSSADLCREFSKRRRIEDEPNRCS